MLFKQNHSPKLARELFQNPTGEYRGAPFWAWNCKLDEQELLRQIEVLKEMGFGGFYMHSRAGMATEYLSEDFMHLVQACVKKAKQEGMLACLYDEDRWPSGTAGGFVTRDLRYRGRYLCFDPEPPRAEEVHLDLGRYAITLHEEGTIDHYRRLRDDEPVEGLVYFAYIRLLGPSPGYNGQNYVDVMNPEAIQRFIALTHEAYKAKLGDEFDRTVPTIFTDEPALKGTRYPENAHDRRGLRLPWTDDLEESFRAAYGESLVEHLPELFWDLQGSEPSLVRYHYHAHVTERFAAAFTDQIGAWCENNGIALTGHMLGESSLELQTKVLGELMPLYRGFQIPGIDMLFAKYELNTAKQCQSAVRQYGKAGMMSELYGVTSWDFDFRGYKLAGDWQAAMGVTVRVPHLAWVSMEGEAKRDYPASINYQSPWYKKFSYVEDHFARLNTALTRGKPIVRIGVIHPVESYWLHLGTKERNAHVCETLESNFEHIAAWLSYGGYDFDYICESTLPDQCAEASFPLRVGEMAYDAVVVPACETLRQTTVARLEAFRAAGGKLIFMGGAPNWMDARPSAEPEALYQRSVRISFSRSELLDALESVREIEIRAKDGTYTQDMLCQMRRDGDVRWLFLCKGRFPDNKDLSPCATISVRIPGRYSVELYDTLTGEIRTQPVTYRNGKTEISVTVYDYDSFLYCLTPSACAEPPTEPAAAEKKQTQALAVDSLVPFTLGEPNVLLLDMAEYALDDAPYHPREELLFADTKCRRVLGWPDRAKGGCVMKQPWCTEEEPITHRIRLRFSVESEIRCCGAMLAIENPEAAKLLWNGRPIEKTVQGYYVDRSIKTLDLPPIEVGENTLEVELPFGERTWTEWCYLLGNFGTRVVGDTAVIVPLPDTLGFSDIVPQGLSFYSGTLDYHLDTVVPEAMDGGVLTVRVPQYRGAVVEVLLDGEASQIIAYAPYTTTFAGVKQGAHRVTVRLYVPRTNGFGPIHLADEQYARVACPDAWRLRGDYFGCEYHLKPEGVMMKPTLTLCMA